MSYSSTHLFQYRHCSSIQYQGKDLDIGRRRGAEVSCGSRELVSGWLSKNKDSRSPAPGAQRATSLLTWQSVALESLHSLTMFHSVLQQVICDMQIIAGRSSRFICSPVLSHGCCCVAFVLLPHNHIYLEYTIPPSDVGERFVEQWYEFGINKPIIINLSPTFHVSLTGESVLFFHDHDCFEFISQWLTLAVQLLQKWCSVLHKET